MDAMGWMALLGSRKKPVRIFGGSARRGTRQPRRRFPHGVRRSRTGLSAILQKPLDFWLLTRFVQGSDGCSVTSLHWWASQGRDYADRIF